MDLTQYMQSAEFPMFRPSGSGSVGVENFFPIILRKSQFEIACPQTIINQGFMTY